MELKELRKAIERYKDTRRNINEFLRIYGDELARETRATLGNHHYYISSLILEIQEILEELGG